MAVPMSVELKTKEIVVNDDLRISFRRTIRVPDNQHITNLPPDLGPFPLKPVGDYVDTMGAAMATKGGIFLPMYQSEAMCINFESRKKHTYMIKIYVGGVNAISGESTEEDEATSARRQATLAKLLNKNGCESDEKIVAALQDCIVVPGQEWLDGVAVAPGEVRQFVAMPFGSGYSIESQITGKDTSGGIQFEVTPYGKSVRSFSVGKPYQLFVKNFVGDTITLDFEPSDTVESIQYRCDTAFGFPKWYSQFVYAGKYLAPWRMLRDYDVQGGSTLHLPRRMRGGGGSEPQPQMSLAAGGKIEQYIGLDMIDAQWQPSRTTVFNVQILNAAVYQAVTGEKTPTGPLTTKDYARYNLPFFKLYEETSDVHGIFDAVKSVAQIEGREDEDVEFRTIPTGAGSVTTVNTSGATLPFRPIIDRTGGVGLVNPSGPALPFRTVADLKAQLKSEKPVSA